MLSENYQMEVDEFKGPFGCSTHRYSKLTFPLHWHTFIEILYMTDGKLQITIQNEKIELAKGDLLFIVPGKLHSVESNWGEFEFINIQFDPIILQNAMLDFKEFLNIYHYLITNNTHQYYFPANAIRKTELPSLIHDIQKEFENKNLGYEISIRANLLLFCLWILRHKNPDDPLMSSEDDFILYNRLVPIFHYIQENYMKDISTTAMAKMAAMSVPHFCRLFKKLTKYSFHIYLQKLRVTEAIKLLLSTDYNITQITSLVGYGDVNFFIRIFKKQVGLAPLQYRNKQKIEKISIPIDASPIDASLDIPKK
jgi:AraC-like DNA-binding protein